MSVLWQIVSGLAGRISVLGILALLGVGAAVYGGYQWGRGSVSQPVRPIFTSDTVEKETPDWIAYEFQGPTFELVYQELDTTVVQDTTIEIPVELNDLRVSSPEPLKIRAGEVVWTHFKPSERRWIRRTYAVPDPTWRAWVDVATQFSLWRGGSRVGPLSTPGVGIEAGLRYKNLLGTISGGLQRTTSDPAVPVVLLGLRYRLLGD